MSDEEKEKVLDLLCDKFVYGLSEEETKELERLGYDPQEAESIEHTIATLGMVDLDAEAEMPASLKARLLRDADAFFGTRGMEEEAVAAADRPGWRIRPLVVWLAWMGRCRGGVRRARSFIVRAAGGPARRCFDAVATRTIVSPGSMRPTRCTTRTPIKGQRSSASLTWLSISASAMPG